MRKFLAFVLAFTFVWGTIPMAATAAPVPKLKDIVGNANQEAIQVCYDLKIVEGTDQGVYEPEKAVNRAEFAALVTRALNIPKSALDSYTSTTFRDTAGYTWAVPYLAFCQQKGIMKGNGYGDAMPGRTITANEAVTMVLRAIGYTDNASVLVGQWPANYVSLAQSQQLYNKVGASDENIIDKAAAAQIIYNALTVQLVQVDANALVTRLFDPRTDAGGNKVFDVPRCLLTAGLDCKSDGETIVTYDNAANSSINLTPYVGAKATLYKRNATGKYVAITEIKTEFLYGKFTFTSDHKVDKFKLIDGTEYTVNGTDKSLINSTSTSSGIDFSVVSTANRHEILAFRNGSDDPSPKKWAPYVIDGEIYNGNKVADQNKVVLGAKVSGKTITEICSIAVWDAEGFTYRFESDSLNSAKTKIEENDLPKDDDGNVDHNAYVLIGADTIEDIAVDNIVYLFVNDNDKIARIEVGTETHSGKVEEFNKAKTEAEIGGKTFGRSPYMDNLGELDVGNEGTVFLDYYNRFYAFDLDAADSGNYAVLMDASTTSTWGAGAAKLFDKTGKEVVYDVKNDVRDKDTTYQDVVAGIKKNLLVKVSMSGGKVSEFDYVKPGDIFPTKSGIKVNPSGTLLNFPKAMNRTALGIESGVIVFVYDGEDFSIGSLNDIKDTELKGEFQIILNKGKIAAFIVDANDAGASTILLMIMDSVIASKGDDKVDRVKALDFKDGTSASAKRWFFTDNTLASKLKDQMVGNYATADFEYPFPEMVEFKVTDDGTLKSPKLITNATDERRISGIDSTGVKYADKNESFDTSGGVITIEYIDEFDQLQKASFESNARLYTIDKDDWKVEKPTRALMSKYSDGGKNKFIFLKSDKDKGYDIIIQVKK